MRYVTFQNIQIMYDKGISKYKVAKKLKKMITKVLVLFLEKFYQICEKLQINKKYLNTLTHER